MPVHHRNPNFGGSARRPSVGSSDRRRSRSSFSKQRPADTWYFPRFAKFLGVFYILYVAFLMPVRYVIRGTTGFYDIYWACNFCLLFSGVGLLIRSRKLVAVCFITIFFDHVVWGTEVLFMLLTSYVPAGPAAYLAWPETSDLEIYSTGHHIFYVPLTLLMFYRSGGLKWSDFVASIGMCFFLSALGRYAAPKSAFLDDGTPYYLNINMGHEMFKDVPFEWLHRLNEAPGLIYLLGLVAIGNGLLHFPAFCFLRLLSKHLLE
eukprot:ANDGO_04981.mRNA.1 hypothetical protein